jgi:WD40 repeat protein
MDQLQERVAIQGPPGEIQAVSFTDGGKGLAVVQRPRKGRTTLRVWSLVTRPESLVVPSAQGVAFLPGNKGLVTIIGESLKRIEPDTGREEILTAGLKVGGVVFTASPDGKAVGLVSGGITVWDVATRAPRFTLEGAFQGFRFSPDSSQVLLSTAGEGIKLFDAKQGKMIRQILAKQPEFCLGAFAPDGRTLAIGGAAKPLQLLDLRTGKVARTLSTPLLPLRYLPDGNRLVVARFARQLGDFKLWDLKLWDLRTDREQARLGQSGDERFIDALSPDGKALATALPDLEVRDTTTGQVRLSFPAIGGLVAFSPDGRFLALAELQSPLRVRVWDTQPIKEVVIRPGR